MDNLGADPIGTAITDPHIYADRDRYHEILTRLRREDPLYWAAPAGYRPFWGVTKHADISEVERQPDLFLSAPRLDTIELAGEPKMLPAITASQLTTLPVRYRMRQAARISEPA